jgi:hypothetical protein
MSNIKQRLKEIKFQIRHAEHLAKRENGSVKLLAVSKTKSAADIALAYQAGQREFAESYLQEALLKQAELAAFDIGWHFIGPIQSNKTKAIATHFSWVHSVDRFKIAKRLSEQRPPCLPDLNILLQVNISAEQTKAGVLLSELAPLFKEVDGLPNIRLRGVMAIPEPKLECEDQRKPFRCLYQAVGQLDAPTLNEFSFGMSSDLKAAILEGSTIVRIGSAIFGARDY